MNRLAKHNYAKRHSALWVMRDAIALEIQPLLNLKIQAENDQPAEGEPSERGVWGKVQTTAGRGTMPHVYSMGNARDNGHGMEDNSPLWTNGHAMAQRDAQVNA